MTTEEFADAPERSRLELRLDGELAGWIDHLPGGPSLILAHTEVLAGHGGAGLGGKLVRAFLEHARSAGKTVIVTCPFALAYVARNPELREYLA